jgi:glycosyltransferase involved in cell wall biosynthesis
VLIHAAVDNDIHPPRFGGAQRSFGLARGLARRHRVRVLCVTPNRASGPPEERVDGVELLRRKSWHTSLAWRLERARLVPMFAAEAGHRANRFRYREALGPGADVLAADLNLSSLLTGASGGAPLRVHTSHNVEYDRFRSSAPPVALRARWAERLRRLEREAVGAAHLTVVCTEEDAARMRELYGVADGRLVVIPNGYDETSLRPPAAAERARARAALGFGERDYVAAFVGADWGPNRAALAMLVERVLPVLAPDGIRLLVVGTVGRSLYGRREPWLSVAGEAPDLAALLHAADCGLNPVLGGGGSNVKVPAYLACGLAVLTTPFGIRGYAPLETHCVVSPPEGFADALRARPRGFAARGESAPAALAEYAWGRLGERLGECCEARLALVAAKGAA